MARCGDSRVLKRWEQLVADMTNAGIPNVPRSSELRRLRFARRSVVMPRAAHYMADERITGHIARAKVKGIDPQWQEIRYAWVCPEFAKQIDESILLGFMLSQLVADASQERSLYGFATGDAMRRTFRYAGFREVREISNPSDEIASLTLSLARESTWDGGEIYIRE